ncbi:MAG: carboxypeptidase-like regulatory domain-containing protein [Myxococcota bacterium]|nr:carboxypeptidase-like regulatory domain-containing protein [Myxococcota bacterium]
MIARLRLPLALLLCASLAACNGTAPTTARIVAAEGGTVTASTHQVAIPAMALTSDVEVTLEAVSAADYPALEGARPEVLRIEPEGTTLTRAATVTIRASFIGAAEGDRVSIAQLATGDGVSTWVPMESARDAATGDVDVPITRFAPLAIVVIGASSAGGIEGTIRWGDSSPAADAPVQLFRGTELVGSDVADAAGAFSFSDLDAGGYRVVVDYECMIDQAVTVVAGEIATQDLVLCGG